MHPEKYTSGKDSTNGLFPFMTGQGIKCYTSEDPLIKNYWGSGFAVPGEKELSPPDATKLIKKYLTDNYYWLVDRDILNGQSRLIVKGQQMSSACKSYFLCELANFLQALADQIDLGRWKAGQRRRTSQLLGRYTVLKRLLLLQS